MIRGLRLLIIGKQGSGKGTLCSKFVERFSLPHISTGDALRAAVAHKTALGLKAQVYMDAGKLVPDDLVMEIVDEFFIADDLRERGFLFDGFPRTTHQADILDVMLAPQGIDAVIDLEVDTDVVVVRLAARRVCPTPGCGAIYSLASPPKVKWICDRCGGEVVQREDDREEAILRRLADYEALTQPLLARYAAADKLVTVDASLAPDDVFASAFDQLVDRGIITKWGN